MKREDVKNKIPGITEEQLNWIVAENGNDVNREKTAAEQYKTQLENTQAQLKTAQDGLAAFDGKKKPEEYEAELAKLKGDMQAQADGFAFDNALNTAILGAKGRSVKAVRALLDLDALKGSKDRSTDISKALEEAAKATPGPLAERKRAALVPFTFPAAKSTAPRPPGTLIRDRCLQGDEPRYQHRMRERIFLWHMKHRSAIPIWSTSSCARRW